MKGFIEVTIMSNGNKALININNISCVIGDTIYMNHKYINEQDYTECVENYEEIVELIKKEMV